MSRDDDLTPQEREALESLPRERMPGRLLEERTVQALHQRGFLRHQRMWTPGRVGLAMAAGLALFMVGVFYGQTLVSTPGSTQETQQQQMKATHPSDAVQQAGAAYVMAMSSLAQMPDSTRNGEYARGREAALAVFREAAGEVVVLVPEDPLAGDILRRLDDVSLTSDQEDEETSKVVWF
jgi:hypothetical protein